MGRQLGLQALSEIELADRLYALALDVTQLNQFLDQWSVYLDDRLAREGAFVFKDSPLAKHFNRAAEILDRMGARRPADSSARSWVDRASGPAIVTDESGRVLATNFDMSVGENVPLSRTLGLSEAEVEALIAWRADGDPECPNVKLLKEQAAGAFEGRSFIATRITLENGARPTVTSVSGVLIQAITIDVGDELSEALQEAFGLSEAEADVARGLASGLRPQDIATSRGASLSTVRTQIKKLQGKMGVGGTTDVVRMLCGFAASQSVRADAAVRVITSIDESVDGVRRSRVRLQDGRSISIAEQGGESDRVVLSFHSMFFGPTITSTFSAALKVSNWRFIAPSRAGYGTSDPFKLEDRLSVEEQVTKTCEDFREVLDAMNIEKAVVLGNGAGSIFAHKFAAMYPERTRALFFVGHAPYWDVRLMSEMTKRQQLLAKTARFAPQAQIFLRKASSALIRSGGDGTEIFIEGNVDGELLDQKAVRRPEVMKILKNGMRHSLSQSVEAFSAEGGLLIRNWPDEMKAVTAPIIALIGCGESAHGQGFIDGYLAAKPSARAVRVDGAGNYLIYTHWQYVLAALNDL